MAPDPSWQVQVTFSDRLESIVNITAAEQSCTPSLDFSQAQSKAKSSEEHNFSTAKSKEDYHRLCYESTQRLLTEREERDPLAQAEGETKDATDGIDIGRYKNARYHRDGLISTIYKAKNSIGDTVALKITTPSVVTLPHDPEKEARALRSISNPHIIPLLEAFSASGGRLILVFPFMQHDLDFLLARHLLTLGQVRSHLRDLFSALAYLHSLDIIHRDVKLSNILLHSPSGPAYLADFGIAWVPNDKGSEPAHGKITDVGTASYRPPELLFGHTKYGTSLDLWAAGCVVSESVRLDNRTLFSSGPVGSELALIQSIFSTLGTPDLERWPEARDLPDWGKMQFRQYPAKPWSEILEEVPESACDLASQLVRFESSERLTALKALQHPFLQLNSPASAVRRVSQVWSDP